MIEVSILVWIPGVNWNVFDVNDKDVIYCIYICRNKFFKKTK